MIKNNVNNKNHLSLLHFNIRSLNANLEKLIWNFQLSPSRRHEAPCEGTNSPPPRLFTPGERNALAKSKVHQISWVHGSPFMGGHPH